MDFTREPIIETIITAREGFRLVIRSSKNAGFEEHFVDAVEVVSFGGAFFFRSLERPKPFLVPVADYEILEVREARMVLKTPVHEGQVKIGSGKERERGEREPQARSYREEARREPPAKMQPAMQPAAEVEKEEAGQAALGPKAQGESRAERRRDRRRGFRRSRRESNAERQERGPQDKVAEEQLQFAAMQAGDDDLMLGAMSEEDVSAQESAFQGTNKPPRREREREAAQISQATSQPSSEQVPPIVRAVLPPPTTLIRDDLQRLRDSEVYRGAFFVREEGEQEEGEGEGEGEAAYESPDADFQAKAERKKEASFEEESFLVPQPPEGEAPKDL